MSVFDKPGLYLRAPDGGVEDVARMKAAGFETIAINVKDAPLDSWSVVRARAAAVGVECIPWGRCLSNQAVTELCDVARQMGTAVLVNCEDELQLNGPVDESHIVKETQGMDACVSTLCWTAGIDLRVLSNIRIHLQVFPQENDSSTRPRDCRARAHVEGSKWARFMHGMHDISPGPLPPLQGAYWVYTADDCANDFEKWGPKQWASLNIPFEGALYPVGHARYVKGKRKWTVRALKWACHRAGYWNSIEPPKDGTFGLGLKEALQRLQRDHGLSATGNYGKGVHDILQTLQAAHPMNSPEAGYALTPVAQAWMTAD